QNRIRCSTAAIAGTSIAVTRFSTEARRLLVRFAWASMRPRAALVSLAWVSTPSRRSSTRPSRVSILSKCLLVAFASSRIPRWVPPPPFSFVPPTLLDRSPLRSPPRPRRRSVLRGVHVEVHVEQDDLVALLHEPGLQAAELGALAGAAEPGEELDALP